MQTENASLEDRLGMAEFIASIHETSFGSQDRFPL